MQTAMAEVRAALVTLLILLASIFAAPPSGLFGSSALAQDAQWIWSPAQENDDSGRGVLLP